MRIVCALLLCIAPSWAQANAAFERAVNGPLRAFESCARVAAGHARQACSGHLAAARANMVRIGYSSTQAASHVALAHDRVIAPRLRTYFERRAAPVPLTGAAPAAAARPERKARPALRGGKTTADPAATPDLAALLADWSLCLEKADADVLAFPVAADMNVDGTASAIARACDGYEPRARALLVASGRSEPEAGERVRTLAAGAREALVAELKRRVAKAGLRDAAAGSRGTARR